MAHRHHTTDVNAGARAAQALQLRQLGFTYERIAQQCGYRDRSVAHNAVMRELKRTIQEPADDVRNLEVCRLDALLVVFMPKALKGDAQAADRVLRIMDRRAGLVGLDAKKDDGPVQATIVREYLPATWNFAAIDAGATFEELEAPKESPKDEGEA